MPNTFRTASCAFSTDRRSLAHEAFGANVGEIIKVVSGIGAVSEPAPALDTVRSHAATFATVEHLFRTRVQDELVQYLDNLLSGVVAVTQHRMLYVPAKKGLPVLAVRYPHIVSIDEKWGAFVLTLASHNVRVVLQPAARLKEFTAYLREHLAHR